MTAQFQASTELCWQLAQQTKPNDVVIVGVGTPLASAAVLLSRLLLHPQITVLFGTAVMPQSFSLAQSIFNSHLVSSAAIGNYTQSDVLDLIARGGVTLQFVSPLQLDAQANFNASRIPSVSGETRRLPGSLALADTNALVGRLVAYRIGHNSRFLTEKIAYETGLGSQRRNSGAIHSPGLGVVAAVTERATISFSAEDNSIPVLTNYSGSLDEVVSSTGFEIDVTMASERSPVPQEVIDALNYLDPFNVRNLEDKQYRNDTLNDLLQQ